MNPTPTQTPTADRELTLTRVFDAPRALVFDAWTQPEHLRRWCQPSGFTQQDSGGDLRPGGEWWTVMHSPSGEEFRMGGIYKEIVPGERLVFTHAWTGDDGLPEHETLITITLADEGGGRTRMTFHQAVFRTVESRDNHRGGWTETFDSLEKYLAGLA